MSSINPSFNPDRELFASSSQARSPAKSLSISTDIIAKLIKVDPAIKHTDKDFEIEVHLLNTKAKQLGNEDVELILIAKRALKLGIVYDKNSKLFAVGTKDEIENQRQEFKKQGTEEVINELKQNLFSTDNKDHHDFYQELSEIEDLDEKLNKFLLFYIEKTQQAKGSSFVSLGYIDNSIHKSLIDLDGYFSPSLALMTTLIQSNLLETTKNIIGNRRIPIDFALKTLLNCNVQDNQSLHSFYRNIQNTSGLNFHAKKDEFIKQLIPVIGKESSFERRLEMAQELNEHYPDIVAGGILSLFTDEELIKHHDTAMNLFRTGFEGCTNTKQKSYLEKVEMYLKDLTYRQDPKNSKHEKDSPGYRCLGAISHDDGRLEWVFRLNDEYTYNFERPNSTIIRGAISDNHEKRYKEDFPAVSQLNFENSNVNLQILGFRDERGDSGNFVTFPDPNNFIEHKDKTLQLLPDQISRDRLSVLNVGVLNGIVSPDEFNEMVKKHHVVVSNKEGFDHDAAIHLFPTIDVILNSETDHFCNIMEKAVDNYTKYENFILNKMRANNNRENEWKLNALLLASRFYLDFITAYDDIGEREEINDETMIGYFTFTLNLDSFWIAYKKEYGELENSPDVEQIYKTLRKRKKSPDVEQIIELLKELENNSSVQI